jgi:predicted DNA-binding transcriptional regulator YafY
MTFEVTKRTIYRDMLALSESGVPIVSIPGQGYSLVEGYFLPPLTFNTDEAIMLLLGINFVAQHFDTQYRNAAHFAGHKIVTVLPERLRHEVEYLENSIQFVALDGLSEPETLRQLRQAIIQHKTVRFRYFARYQDNPPETERLREVDPYALIHIGGAWMLIAYCHLRHDTRHFRLDRMEDVIILENVFTRPADFKIQHGSEDDRTVIVRVLFDSHIAQRVRESPSGFQVGQAEHPDGLLVMLTVRQPADVLNWLLSWGSHVRVLEPESLQMLLFREAQGILENHPIQDIKV